MKHLLNGAIIGGIFGLIAVFIGFISYIPPSDSVGRYYSSIEKKRYIIEFPEEIELISPNKHIPDTLIGYIKGDTLVFRYLVSERYFNSRKP